MFQRGFNSLINALPHRLWNVLFVAELDEGFQHTFRSLRFHEKFLHKLTVYGPYFIYNNDGKRRYVGCKPTATQIISEEKRRTLRKQIQVERKQYQVLDAQLKDLTTVTKTLMRATLYGAHYHEHKRTWRRRRMNNNYDGEQHAMQNTTLTLEAETATYNTLENLVQQAQKGDTTTLPAIRHLLDQMPALWEDSRILATQIERLWITTISGRDLISREVLEREVQTLRAQLLGPHPSPLETLLVDRICTCWLAVQHAEFIASKRLSPHSCTLSNAGENRLDKTHRRFLAAIRELARVRKLLTPDQKF